MLTLYTNPMSPCAQKVRIVLAEKGLEWTPVHVDLQNKQNLEPDYLKLNPLGVVPTLVDNGKPIIESSLICEYLDEAYPQTPLRPEDPYLRAQIRLWCKHIDNKLHPSCGALQWPLVMRPTLMEKTEEERNALLERVVEKPRRERQKRLVKFGLEAPDVVDAVKTYHNTIIKMEAALEDNAWLVGDQFSIADCAMAPYFQTVIQFGWQEIFADYPRVADWIARVTARPSYQTAVSADFPPETVEKLLQVGAPAWPIIQRHLAA
ncbi:MAG: glutathione S-transferase [Kordiimonas sp.]|nr:glutathione S-transferase [Kordiimonas sp.]